MSNAAIVHPPARAPSVYQSKDKELRRLIFAWIEQQESKHTRRAYLAIASSFFGLFPGLSLREIQVEHVTLFKRLQKEKYATSTVAQRVAAIRGFFRWLNEQQVLDRDPARAVRIPRQDAGDGKTPEITDAEVKRLVSAPDRAIPRELRDAVLLEWLYHTGLRNAEIRHLQLKHIGEEGQFIVLSVRGKGDQVRRLPLRPFLLENLEHYLRASGRQLHPDSYLFVGCAGGGAWNESPLTGTAVLNIVRKYAKRAGIRRKICVHTARVTATNNALERGSTDAELVALMGWKSRQSITRYTRRRDQLRNNAADRISY